MEENNFIDGWKSVSAEVKRINEEHGWEVENTPDGLLTKIALVHSELSEAVEAIREGNPPDDKIPEFTGVEAEFADAVIRMMHICEVVGLDLPSAVIAKCKFNEGRPYKHGGKLV